MEMTYEELDKMIRRRTKIGIFVFWFLLIVLVYFVLHMSILSSILLPVFFGIALSEFMVNTIWGDRKRKQWIQNEGKRKGMQKRKIFNELFEKEESVIADIAYFKKKDSPYYEDKSMEEMRRLVHKRNVELQRHLGSSMNGFRTCSLCNGPLYVKEGVVTKPCFCPSVVSLSKK